MAKKKESVKEAPEENTAEEPVTTAPVEAGFAASEEERRLAAVAHGGILLNLVTGIGGPILALILWLLYDRKSEYVSWHALQALIFQTSLLIATLVVGGIAAILWVITLPLMHLIFVASLCLLPFTAGFSLLTLGLLIGGMIYGCAGALAVLEGQEFRYRWISDWIPPLSKP